MKLKVIILSIVVLLGCKKNTVDGMGNIPVPEVGLSQNKVTYLALGDSYTIGESVPLQSNFPYQLSARLKTEGLDVGKPDIIARTGWTSAELQAAIRSAALKGKYDIVTLLIGVNNQYRGQSSTEYRKEFKDLLQTAIDFANGKKAGVFVLSIPDWGVSPYGLSSGRDKQRIATEIDLFNAINKEETLAAGVSYTDITILSRNAETDKSLVAGDGLHYSEKMHGQWVAKLSPAIIKVLK